LVSGPRRRPVRPIEFSGPTKLVVSFGWGDRDRMRPLPKLCRYGEGINPLVLPPGALVAMSMQLLMMLAAERPGKLVADLPP
jgi:hypothetical protein